MQKERAELQKTYTKADVLAKILLFSPIAFPILLVAVTSIKITESTDIIFSLLHIIGSILALFAASSILKRSGSMSVITAISITWYLIESLYFIINYSNWSWRFITMLLLIALFAFFLYFSIRITHFPYFSPRIRWWESDPRYLFSVKSKLVYGNSELKGSILDINSRGCFIKMFERIPLNQLVLLDFSLFDEPYSLRGKVVNHGELSVTHPRGLGILFDIEHEETSVELKRAAQNLRRLNRTYNKITFQNRWNEFAEKHSIEHTKETQKDTPDENSPTD